MDNLFNRAWSNYNSAKILYAYINKDETQLNIIGYHLQQSVELAIKFILEQNGVEYPKTHDIDQLIRIGNDNKIDMCLTDYIELSAEMITNWESKSRYVIGYLIEKKKIDKAVIEIEKYLILISEQYNK